MSLSTSSTATPRGRVGFAVGTGRCGTTFLARALAMEPGVASVHQRDPLVETFHRYAAWYGLPVDRAGLVETLRPAIERDLERHALSFESSPFLSLNLRELHRAFDARIVVLVRSPQRVVDSLLRKGWYADDVPWEDASRAPGLNGGPVLAHHQLGRPLPRGPEREAWAGWTRVGKIAWYWSALNAAVLEQLDDIPADRRRIVRLEELDHDAYRALLAELFGVETVLDRARFEELVAARPNRGGSSGIEGWGERERAELEANVASVAARLGYDPRVPATAAEVIDAAVPYRPDPAPRRVLARIRRDLGRRWRRRGDR